MGGKKRQEIITFKVNEALAEAMRDVPNRSEFIRSALLAALENTCPLCMGTGFFTVDQRRHWDAFAQKHSVQTCDDCDAVHLVCHET